MKIKSKMFASVSLAVLCAAPVAFAQTAPATSEPAADQEVETIVVYGAASSRQTQAVTASAISLSAPGVSPLKAIERLPGVNFQSADALGNYEWSTRISVRGFNQNQMGFTLDGVPLGDMSYGNHNGLHVSRATISENLARVELSQGAGALGTASSSNLGGTLQFISRNPSDDFGGQLNLSGGSDSLQRIFARVETGTLDALGGGKGYVSVASTKQDKWKGAGEQNHDQVNIKYVQPVSAATVTAVYNWSDRAENDYQDLSLEMIRRLGYKWDNISGNYALANLLADIANNRGDTGAAVSNPAVGRVYPSPITSVDDAYFDASGLRKDNLAYVTLDLPVNDKVELTATIYNHTNEGQGTWFTPYVATPVGAPDQSGSPITAPSPISVRTTEYEIARTGAFGSLTINAGAHQVSTGLWVENNQFDQARGFYGLARAANIRASLEFMANPFFTQWAYRFDTSTLQFWVQDNWSVSEALTVNLGFKAVRVTNEVTTTTINNGAPTAANGISGKLRTSEAFLPQVGFKYELSPTSNVFGTFSRNVAAYVSAATAGPFASRNQANVNEVSRTLDPEKSTTGELGWRVRGDKFEASVAGYVVRFENRLLGISQGAGIVGNAPILSNVGAVNSYGTELVGIYKLTDEFNVFGSLTYNKSEYADNVVNRAGVVVTATKGKQVVNTPELLFKGELAYDNGSLFAKLGASYTGERYFTYMNDDVNGKVDAYTLAEITLGYRFGGNDLLEGLEAQLNVTNASDEQYVSTIGSNGFGNSGDSQTLLAGAPQQVVFTLKKAF
ncbi:TonB-dependent receptor domain-containing protein [Aquidulcibacter sp.]|jgi:iron complex outermembrane receptor protein|uniref:TonB-dependent receptor n=1 Tax=Aquidulcibacter sp. TaxID=2052990 RepID=UPI0028AEACF9|nr:TonB-dependent receptor [Aquidulcibacter sp.]